MQNLMRKTPSFILASAIFIALLSAGNVYAHKNHKIGASEHPAIKARHKLMADSVFAAKQAGMMVKGATPYDAGKAELSMRLISAAAFNMDKYFPKASIPKKGSKSEASPKIWNDMADFLNEIEKFKVSSNEAIKLAGQGEDAFKGGFMKVMKSCKSCHENYRIKKQ